MAAMLKNSLRDEFSQHNTNELYNALNKALDDLLTIMADETLDEETRAPLVEGAQERIANIYTIYKRRI